MKQELLKTGTESVTEIWYALVEGGRLQHVAPDLDFLIEHEGYNPKDCFPVKIQVLPQTHKIEEES